MSIRKLEEQLPAANFMRVHRSFLVHLEKIKTVERSRIVFDSKTYVPVGEQYKLKFQKFLDEYFIK